MVRRGQRDGGLLNLVPRYLPRYGMAPEWARLSRPLEHSAGLWIALAFAATTLLVSRVLRPFELRVAEVELDEAARRFVEGAEGELRLIAHHREQGSAFEYGQKEREVRLDTHLPGQGTVLFLEVGILDPSEFSDAIGYGGSRWVITRCCAPSPAAFPTR